MANTRPDGPDSSGGESRPRRRPRYSGTHPKRFEHRYKELDPAAHPEIHEHIRSQGRTPAGTHVPVLVEDVLAALRPAPGEVVADCTIGYGGHAVEFLRRIGPTGRLIGLDVDGAQLERTAQRLAAEPNAPVVRLHRSHFAGLGKRLNAEGLDGYDVILADLGVSSMQVDDAARGFSYKHDGPLDMRMDDRLVRTAADVLQSWSVEDLSAALRELADEPDHERIARSIVERRKAEAILRTTPLVRLVLAAKGLSRRAWRQRADAQPGDLHPAARTFQALRMVVNDELAGLDQFLRTAPWCLRPGGRIGVISFHSGEDHRVGQSFHDGLAAGTYAAISDDAITPTPREIAMNPRSRSARFRWARKASQATQSPQAIAPAL